MSHLAVAGMPALGHLNPSLALVRALTDRGVRVSYYSDPRFRSAVERVGAGFVGYPPGTVSEDAISAATRAGGSLRVARIGLEATETLVAFLRSEWSSARPDAVLFDSSALWGYLAATSLGLPRVSLMTTIALGAADYRDLTPREWRVALRTAVPDLLPTLRARRRVSRRFGRGLVPPPPMLPLRGDLTLSPVTRDLQPELPFIDERWRFVGPLVDPTSRDETVDPELAAHLAGPAPVVLISLGTLHDGTGPFFRDCVRALAALPVHVLLATGTATDPARLDPLPANVLARTALPQLAVLRRAAVFVTHGGMNSVLEALVHQVPLVVLPQQVEQLAIGNAVAGHAAGVVLREHLSGRPLSPHRLRTAVEQVLAGPGPREAAATLGSRLSAAGGSAAAADAVHQLL